MPNVHMETVYSAWKPFSGKHPLLQNPIHGGFMGFDSKAFFFFLEVPKNYARKDLEQFQGMFSQQWLICISILAPLVFERHG